MEGLYVMCDVRPGCTDTFTSDTPEITTRNVRTCTFFFIVCSDEQLLTLRGSLVSIYIQSLSVENSAHSRHHHFELVVKPGEHQFVNVLPYRNSSQKHKCVFFVLLQMLVPILIVAAIVVVISLVVLYFLYYQPQPQTQDVCLVSGTPVGAGTPIEQILEHFEPSLKWCDCPETRGMKLVDQLVHGTKCGRIIDLNKDFAASLGYTLKPTTSADSAVVELAADEFRKIKLDDQTIVNIITSMKTDLSCASLIKMGAALRDANNKLKG